MDPSQTYDVPQRIGLLYDFLNSLDLRRYIEHGRTHEPNDRFPDEEALGTWMRRRGLLDAGDSLAQADFVAAMGLRAAIRSFVEAEPGARNASPAALGLNEIAARFPLLVRVPARPSPWLAPQPGSSRLGLLLVQLCDLAQSGDLDRLKMCASDDCKWIFFDRSKPGNRRWCSTSLCGNRHKIRSYRERQRASRAI